MPKVNDYPSASLKSAIELAVAVDDLGGSCSTAMAAERMSRKVSGAFNALTSSASKYGLIDSKAQKLTVTQLFREYKLAYSEEERKLKLRSAMLNVPIFSNIYERFANKDLPLAHLDKLLIREFGVPDDWGSRVSGYLIEGGRESGLLDENHRVVTVAQSDSAISSEQNKSDSAEQQINSTDIAPDQPANLIDGLIKSSRNYFVRISGPGMDSNIEVNEIDDLEIVEVMLKKVKKALENSVE